MADPQRTKAVHTFTVGEDDDLTTVFAFTHGLADADVLVSVQNRQGRNLSAVKVTVQDENVIVVENPVGFNNGDKIVVRP